MKIGIISDTHGYPKGWKTAVDNYFGDAELIVHCGDALYHGPRNPIIEGHDPFALIKEMNESKIPVLICKGNCDAEVDEMVLKWPIISPYVFLQDGKTRILALHGQNMSDDALVELGKKFNANLILTGHTHINRTKMIENIVLFNPGSISLPKENSGASCAYYDNGHITLFDINTKAIIKDFTLN